MIYFFPSPFTQNEVVDTKGVSLGFTVNSGKNALRVALRSFGFERKAKIGIPAFCCDEVVISVKEENLIPVFFDLKSDGTYWANYDIEKIKKYNIKLIIITHLYGFLHPDTQNIVEVFKLAGVKMIHDVAQSFGVDTTLLADQPIVYSYGPGKSTTAARGGEVQNTEVKNVQLKKSNYWSRKEAKLFFKSRIFGNKISKFDVLTWKVCKKLMEQNDVFVELSDFQKQKAVQAKILALQSNNGRKQRYELLKNAIKGNSELKIAFEFEQGLWFKIVIKVTSDVNKFLNYLNQNSVPYVRLADSMNVGERNLSDLPEFEKSYLNFVEFSTERSITIVEIERVASILTKYER